MNFDFTNVSETTYKNVNPGIGMFTIEEVSEGRLKYKDQPCVTLKFRDKDGAMFTDDLDMSNEKIPNNKDGKTYGQASQERLFHIANKVVSENEFKNATNINEVSALLIGKQLWLKVRGREWMTKDGDIRVNLELPLYNFAAKIETDNDGNILPCTTLSFDKGKMSDYYSLPKDDSDLPSESTKNTEDSLF